jgi:hypothetical protein
MTNASVTSLGVYKTMVQQSLFIDKKKNIRHEKGMRQTVIVLTILSACLVVWWTGAQVKEGARFGPGGAAADVGTYIDDLVRISNDPLVTKADLEKAINAPGDPVKNLQSSTAYQKVKAQGESAQGFRTLFELEKRLQGFKFGDAAALGRQAELDKQIAAVETQMRSPAVQKYLKTETTNVVNGIGDQVLKTWMKNPTTNPSEDILKRLDEWRKTASQLHQNIATIHIQNPNAKLYVIKKEGAKRGYQIQKNPRAVNQSRVKQQQAVAKTQNEFLNAPDATPAEVVNKNSIAELLKSGFKNMNRNERIGWSIAGFSVVAAVVGTVVGILVKPPYWNDDAVLDGSSPGATPGQQPAVDFINWVNENPAVVTMSSCMSCICCCCCCCLLIIMMTSGGKKNNNFTL